MQSCSFHTQLLSVVELLARAAAQEMDRRVELGCAVLRVEVSRGRRDIELLRRKCEGMEAEMRRSRIRARRKVFYPPAAERFTPSVKLLFSRERHVDRQVDVEAPCQPQQCPSEDGDILIKEECAEEDMWKNDKLRETFAEAEHPPCFQASQPALTDSFTVRLLPDHPGSPAPPEADAYDGFPEPQLNGNQGGAELVVKHEREEVEEEQEPEENTAPPLPSACKFEVEEGGGQLWSSNQSFLYDGQQFQGIPSAFPSQSSMHLEEVEPRSDSEGKSHVVVGAARGKRTFGCRKPPQEEGRDALNQINTVDQCTVPQDSQHHTGEQNEDLTPQSQGGGGVGVGGGGGAFVLSRRMCAPWRTGGVGEKRFSCTFCDKSFMRFSQLKEHLRSHTGEKPFSCLQCGRSFTKQCNLIRHAVVHSGEKPYECSLCGKCFTQRSSLKSHQKTAH